MDVFLHAGAPHSVPVINASSLADLYSSEEHDWPSIFNVAKATQLARQKQQEVRNFNANCKTLLHEQKRLAAVAPAQDPVPSTSAAPPPHRPDVQPTAPTTTSAVPSVNPPDTESLPPATTHIVPAIHSPNLEPPAAATTSFVPLLPAHQPETPTTSDARPVRPSDLAPARTATTTSETLPASSPKRKLSPPPSEIGIFKRPRPSVRRALEAARAQAALQPPPGSFIMPSLYSISH